MQLRKPFIVMSAAMALFSLSGCASIVDGSHQVLSIVTPNVKGATCTAKNNKGTFYVNSTPGTVTVHRSMDALHIDCAKPGYQDGIAVVKSSTKKMAFGNILAGGIIGGAVDAATGAAFDYPQKIIVPMRLVGVSAAPKATTVTPPLKRLAAKNDPATSPSKKN